MKLKTLALVFFFSLFSHAFAANLHIHPKADDADKKIIEKNMNYPGFCEIELINDSFTDVRVFGLFDDGVSLDFNIYRYEYPRYISLFYNFYCHSGMYISIESPFYTVYSGWTSVGSTIRIVPYLKNQAKVQVSHK